MENYDTFDHHDKPEHDQIDGPIPAEQERPRTIQAAIGWLYDRAISGIAGLESAEMLAARYLADSEGDVVLAVRNMIHWESIKAGSSGFLSGVGGIVALPATLPLNITSVLFLQTRLVAAIACLGRHNLADERIRALAGLCLCGNAAKALLQEIALQAVERWTTRFTQQIVEKTLLLIATRISMSTGGQFVRMIPLAGGIVNGAVDITTTCTIGSIASRTFLERQTRQQHK